MRFSRRPECIGKLALKLLKAHILSANEMQEFVMGPFKKILSQIQSMSRTDFTDVVKLISLTIRSLDIALDPLLKGLEPESSTLLSGLPELQQISCGTSSG